MIRIELIGVIVVALASTCPARAQILYRCVPEGQMAAPDQRVSFEVAITPNGDFSSIIFRAADGTAYGRGQQFDEQNRQDGNGQHYWTGTSRTNPNVTIVGSLSGNGDRLVYSETISDRSLGNVQITSTCTPIVEWLASSVVRDIPSRQAHAAEAHPVDNRRRVEEGKVRAVLTASHEQKADTLSDFIC